MGLAVLLFEQNGEGDIGLLANTQSINYSYKVLCQVYNGYISYELYKLKVINTENFSNSNNQNEKRTGIVI